MQSQQIIDSRELLIVAVEQGIQPEYVFFWQLHKSKKVDAQCLSQWYPAAFDVDGIRYPTAEHYMMAEKARVFGDEEIRQQILRAIDPEEVKKLGRQVLNFDTKIWEQHRLNVVVRGNTAKFGQNEALKTYLLSPGGKILVEASPYDTIWGVGLKESDPRILDPRQWNGFNLLGFALMTVRRRLN